MHIVPKKIFKSEGAVSEVVDTILILGIMLIAISIIGVAGYPALQNIQEHGHTENIKQSHIVLGENINKVVFDMAPSQSVELKMYGGNALVSGTSTINVTMQTWNSSSAGLENQTFKRQMREIKHSYEETAVAYENTGVWAKYGNEGTIMVKKPGFVLSDNNMIIPVAAVMGSNGISGEGLIRVIADGGYSSVFSYENVSSVDITVKSDYYTGWENYLNETMGMQVINRDETNTTVHLRKEDFSENIDVYITHSPMKVRVE
ncbi:MAG: hypothetical protein AWU58_795 [Methanohalophilus sp. T328-1]|jgi:hypothetical protein|uniref:Uncharacterized protein n=1 Tax=Methanohalophilus euhalobius TaxID=51203 RepID=A0A285EY17_9EURY|nr:MAG: hypothetical protein AWU58_795 [Methanohalophilus sp. T328-1]OBZ36010.1 MAG: hypothetical protein A9957_05100 [Methanohalophilus sp. DAL1]ODV50631.1 MAG: hypothetical protein A8273_172 [Methanohalophilus sp. 2-GBenrich]RSD36111.1 MAG: hypothetical protein CI952_452 [Methanohalophilus sp.]RXG34691.1 hypothetical protein CI957_744 [Methanohalophilus sp. WG1-DM]TCL12650.1 hypothetical protein C7960_1920 [Methanohalophilus euhalobius]